MPNTYGSAGSSASKTFSTSRFSKVLLCLFLLVLPIVASAETVYVDDHLRVGVRPNKDSHSSSLTVVSSGTEVEVLARSGSYIKVRTSNGVEGWARAAYFSKQKPAMLKLKEARKEIDGLKSKLASLRAEAPKDDAQINSLKQQLERLQMEKDGLLRQLEAAQQQVGPVAEAESASASQTGSSLRRFLKENKGALTFSAGGFLFILCLGFLLGVGWHKRQVTKRLGGLTL